LQLIVIASIHQPSTATFALFDKLLLLSGGRTAYNGPVDGVRDYFASIGFEMPYYTNPAEFIMEIVNDDFSHGSEKPEGQVERVKSSWNNETIIKEVESVSADAADISLDDDQKMANPLLVPLTLVHRSFIKSYRDVIAYGIRVAMYLGLAIMMGTVWLRLSTEQKNIQNWINAIV
jgi:ABC-type multidrug transport system ATPase subunit